MENSERDDENLNSLNYDSDGDRVPPPPPEDISDSDSDNEVKPPPDYDDDEDDDIDDEAMSDSDMENEESMQISSINNINTTNKSAELIHTDDFDTDSDDETENYLQKFDESINQQIIADFHPEMKNHNYDEIINLSKVTRNADGIIIDPLHCSIPFITRYEKAKIIGERSKQLSAGATPFVKVDETVIDEYLIACKEFNEKKIPFIVKRPMPNGGCEYWRFEDLEILV